MRRGARLAGVALALLVGLALVGLLVEGSREPDAASGEEGPSAPERPPAVGLVEPATREVATPAVAAEREAAGDAAEEVVAGGLVVRFVHPYLTTGEFTTRIAGEDVELRGAREVRIPGLAAGTHRVEITKPGWGSRTVAVDHDGARTVRDVSLEPLRWVRVRCVDGRTRELLERADVVPTVWERQGGVLAGLPHRHLDSPLRDGVALVALDHAEPRRWQLELRHPGMETWTSPEVDDPPLGEHDLGTVVLHPEGHSIAYVEARVVDAASGGPVPDAEVGLDPASFEDRQRMGLDPSTPREWFAVDAQGRALLEVPSGVRVRLRARSSRHVPVLAEARTFEPGARAEWTVELAGGTTLVGTVLLDPLHPTRVARASTVLPGQGLSADVDYPEPLRGVFELHGLPPGTHVVELFADHPRRGTLSLLARRVTVAGEERIEVTFDLGGGAVAGAVRGRVRDHVEESLVMLVRVGDAAGWWRNAWPDTSGEFSLGGVEPGAYALLASFSEPGASGWLRREVQVGAELQPYVELEFGPPAFTLRWVSKDAPYGHKLVRLYALDGAEVLAERGQPIVLAKTDATGEVALHGLPLGRYRVRPFSGSTREEVVRVDRPGQVLELEAPPPP